MKKVLSFVLVLAMILGSFSMVFAANFSDVEDGADHEEAINVLSALGVVSGYTDGTFKPEKVVTRAEMAAFLINALFGEDKQITQRATKFSDVTAAHWASGFVDYANTLGIISGYTDGTFKPDQPVAYNEAITMVVKALGYTDDCLPGEYPARYVNQAKALNLLTEVDGLGTAGAVRGDIAQLVYNALECYIGTVNKDGDWNPIETKTGKDSMLKRLGCAETPAYELIDLDILERAIVDLSDYLGAEAKYVYNVKTGDILGVSDVKTTFITGEYDADEETIGTYSVKGLTPVHYFKNGEDAGSFAFDNEKEYTLAVYTSASGKTIKSIYSALYWKADDVFMVEDDDIEDILDNDWDYTFAENDDKEIDTKSFILVGVDNLEDIEEDNVLTVFVGERTHTVTKLGVGTKTVTGKITKLTSTKATVEGTAYDRTKFDTVDFDNEYALYFDYEDNLYLGTIVEEDSESLYAVVVDVYGSDVAAGWKSETASISRMVKLFTYDGETVTYEVSGDEDLLHVTDSAIGFKNSIEKNTLVEYTLDDDGAVDTMTRVTGVVTGTKTISKAGVLDKRYIASDATVITYTAKGAYSLKTAKDVQGLANAQVTYTINKKGQIDVVLAGPGDGINEDAVYGVFTGEDQTASKVYTVYFMVDGEEEAIDSTKASGLTVDGSLKKITFTGSKYDAVEAVETARTKAITVLATTGASITEGQFKAATTEEVQTAAVAPNAFVYIYNSSKKTVTAGTLDDLNTKKACTVTFYDLTSTPDDVYDVVVITK